ncbi:hypothetical protein [Halobaculum sp. EA56]|uniref:hypothetical protein n=1 Tax=Halobaculum sp. EA56 TaxID=3421648 RepID=UPI003EB950BF
MTTVEHPRAGDGPGVPPAVVDVNGEHRTVDEDGRFEVDDEAWLRGFADRHGVDSSELVHEEDGPPNANAPFDPSEFTVDELRDEVDDVDDPDALEALRAHEQHQKDRETAVDAIDARLDELSADEESEA